MRTYYEPVTAQAFTNTVNQGQSRGPCLGSRAGQAREVRVMRRALTIAATIYTASRLARLLHMPARPIVTAPKVAPKAAPTVDLVKWEQEPDRISWDPAADLLDEAAAEMALIVHSGWGAGFLALWQGGCQPRPRAVRASHTGQFLAAVIRPSTTPPPRRRERW